MTIGDKDSLYYCLDIIATVLGISRKNLWKYEPNINIPKDDGIYYAASEVSANNYATNTRQFDDIADRDAPMLPSEFHNL